jgi:polyisoprenoid-binding protein YceI
MPCRPRHVISPTAAIAAIAIALAFAGPASAQRHDIDVQRSTITIHVFKSGLFRAFADDHLIQTTLAQGFVDDSTMAHVDLVVDAERLRVLDPNLSAKDREQVQMRMLGSDVLDATRFPQIRFHSTAVQRLGADHWLVRGELDLHGQTHEVAVNVARENGRYTGRATLRQTDFAIAPISIAGGTVKVKNEISIEFDIVTADR